MARVMEGLLHKIVWPVSPEHRCPYLPDRQAREEIFLASVMDADDYVVLMNHGWRRSGCLFYRPRCDGCGECVPIRLRTDTFRPSRSQRRVWRWNQDLAVTVGRPTLTDEKHRLYVRYLRERHDGTMGEDIEDLARFLYSSPIDTREMCYRLEGALVGVGIVDVSSTSVSTVYFIFDPDHHRRSLGTFSTLWEIDWARRQGREYYYLGYLIRGLQSMSYKAAFAPHEVLGADGQWHPTDG